MAHLLLMYQYMRAKREYNTLTAQSFKNQTKKTRIKKNIEKTQKYYTDAIAKISSQAKLMVSQANSIFQNNLLGGAGVMNSYLDPTGYGRANGFALNYIAGQFENNGGTITFNQDSDHPVTIDRTEYEAFLRAQNEGVRLGQDSNNSYQTLVDSLNCSGINSDNIKEKLAAFNQLQQIGSSAYYSAQQQVNTYSTNFQQNVNIWEEAMKAQLEAQQDMALEPLNYEETMMELEETTIKASLEEKKAEMDSLKQELSERIKEDVPKFGLA